MAGKIRKPAASPEAFLKREQAKFIKAHFSVLDACEDYGLKTQAVETALHNAAKRAFENKVALAEKFWGSLEVEAAKETLGMRWSPLQGDAWVLAVAERAERQRMQSS